MANISVNNMDKNAPWWWKRLESGLIFMFTGLIPLIGLSAALPTELKNDIAMVWLPGAIVSLKTLGIMMGDSIEQTIIKNKEDKP